MRVVTILFDHEQTKLLILDCQAQVDSIKDGPNSDQIQNKFLNPLLLLKNLSGACTMMVKKKSAGKRFMANTTKHERVRQRFICDQVKNLKEQGLKPQNVFEGCWNRIPDPLIQKLNAEDLLQYIQRHVLPAEILSVATRKNSPTESI